jgi:ribosome recycling factor
LYYLYLNLNVSELYLINKIKAKKNKERGLFMNDLEERMKKTVSVYEENLSEIRAGRANPAVLNKISVEYYGVPTPINQVAGISVPEARMIVIQPWDVSILKEIEKAILASDIGLNPNNDGKVIRLNFPELTEERRKELVKDIRKIAEESKVAIRSIRRDGMEDVKAKQKNSEITEDEKAVKEDEIQKLTDKYIAEIDKILANKEKEILNV